jgi:hypothetical protein
MQQFMEQMAPFLLFSISAFFLRFTGRLLWIVNPPKNLRPSTRFKLPRIISNRKTKKRQRLGTILVNSFLILLIGDLFVLSNLFKQGIENPGIVVAEIAVFAIGGILFAEAWILIEKKIRSQQGKLIHI